MTGGADADLALAHRLADAARVVSLSFFKQKIERWSKADGSLATEADVAIERALRAQIGVERPDDAVLGEEEGQTGSSGRRWILDAIDGTIEFAAGIPLWSTFIALEVDGGIMAGVCDQPALLRRYHAGRGRGGFVSDAAGERRLQVSGVADLSAARSYAAPDEWLRTPEAIRAAGALANATRPETHHEHPILQVATGAYDAGAFFMAGPWDLAAPSIVLEEAGGRLTDLRGRPDLFTGVAVFTNGHVHEAALRVMAS